MNKSNQKILSRVIFRLFLVIFVYISTKEYNMFEFTYKNNQNPQDYGHANRPIVHVDNDVILTYRILHRFKNC